MNKVILIGGNHHNILGAVRSFGVNHIYPFGIIIGTDSRGSFVRKSKYWSKTWAIDSEELLIDFLLEHFTRESEKPVIICCSDASAKMIDLHYDCLQDYFLLPSIRRCQGNIAELMDKYLQKQFADKNNIRMARTFIINLDNISMPTNMNYPCIVKPKVSAEGQKSDIRKCDTQDQVITYLQTMKKKGYCQFLIQEYLKYDAEYLMVGSIHNDNCSWINSRKIRVWPIIGGSSSCLQVTAKERVVEFYDTVRKTLRRIGYDGIFDVEAFDVNGKIYLNEINWRNSGTAYFCMGTNVHYLVLWYYWKTNQQPSKKLNLTCTDENIYSIDESLDLRHVVCKKVTLKRWLQDAKKARVFAIWCGCDLKPTIAEYMHLVKEFIRRRSV